MCSMSKSKRTPPPHGNNKTCVTSCLKTNHSLPIVHTLMYGKTLLLLGTSVCLNSYNESVSLCILFSNIVTQQAKNLFLVSCSYLPSEINPC